MSSFIIEAMERRLLPDALIRFGIRKLLRERLLELRKNSLELEQKYFSDYIEVLKNSPVAVHTQDANQQHYELPPEFFNLVLGRNRKYSSSYWPLGCGSLDEAEDVALAITIARAKISDGMKILELGCGWGSLTLDMARKFPTAKITAISNSGPQREFIEAILKKERLTNVTVLTRDVSTLESLEESHFDRVISVEMFEHLRNYQEILRRISNWLAPEGKLFIHIFTHQKYPYFFETEGDDNWMGRYFFTGGQMPSHHLLTHFQNDLTLEEQWAWDGTHYGKTSEAWLQKMDQHQREIRTIFVATYGEQDADRWVQRWRVFFMSCAELFNYKNGTEWGVSHYLFTNRR